MHAFRAAVIPALALILGATPSPPSAITLTASIQRTSFDLLDSVAIGVVAHNPAGTLATVHFTGPQEDLVEVLDSSGGVIWSSKPPPPPKGVTFPPHVKSFVAGPTTVIVRVWNEMTSGGWSPVPGKYTIRVALLADHAPKPATATVTFGKPLPPSALPALHAGEPVTLSGNLDAVRGTIEDASGSAPLSRRLISAPPGTPVVVRGYATDSRSGARTFTVTRWAPLGPPQLATPSASSSPAPSPAPTRR